MMDPQPELARTRPRTASTQREELALLVNQIAQSITGTLELERVFELTVQKTRALLEAESAALLLLDESTGELYLDAYCGAAELGERVLRLSPGQGLAGWVALNAEPVLVVDAARDPRCSPSIETADGAPVRSIVAAPLVAGNKVLGVLAVANPIDGEPFEEADLEALCWLGPHVAVAVKNSRNASALIRSQLELARANRALEKRVEERTAQIARAKREWELTFDSIPEPIFLLDGFTVRRANTAFASLAGVPITEVVGRTCHALLACRDTPCPGCPLAGEGRGEATVAGRTFEVSSFALPEGRAERVVAYRDVTDARAMEQKLRESERLASVGQLASGAAHEINNPLAFLKSNLGTLQSYFEDLERVVARVDALEPLVRQGELARAQALVEKGLVPSDVRSALEDVPLTLAESLDGVRRVARIVQALKALTRDPSREAAREEIGSLIERAAFRAEIAPERLVLEQHVDSAIEVEPNQLELALANILRNARQASPPGAAVRVVTEEHEGRVRISVVDSGSGIDPEVRARIFDPFFTTRETGSGVGLGLTAAWGIINRHGGAIDVESRPGGGTTVRVELPAAPKRP